MANNRYRIYEGKSFLASAYAEKDAHRLSGLLSFDCTVSVEKNGKVVMEYKYGKLVSTGSGS